jgi:hypothetical protein
MERTPVRRRFVIRARSILVAAFLSLTTFALTASAVLADGMGAHVP